MEAAAANGISPGRAKMEVYLTFAHWVSKDMQYCRTYEQRRKFIRDFRKHDWPFGDEEFHWAYAMFLSHYPEYLPYNERYDKRREREEESIWWSGTERKTGRNFRMPGEMGFSISRRQQELFGGWSFPAEGEPAQKDQAVVTGPSGEQERHEAKPPQGVTWKGMDRAAKQAASNLPPFFDDEAPTADVLELIRRDYRGFKAMMRRQKVQFLRWYKKTFGKVTSVKGSSTSSESAVELEDMK